MFGQCLLNGRALSPPPKPEWSAAWPLAESHQLPRHPPRPGTKVGRNNGTLRLASWHRSRVPLGYDTFCSHSHDPTRCKPSMAPPIYSGGNRLWARKHVPETSRLAEGRAGKNSHVTRWSPVCHSLLVLRKAEQWGRPGLRTAPRLLLPGLPEPRQGTDDKTAPSVSTYWLPDAVQRCDCGHSYTANNPLA